MPRIAKIALRLRPLAEPAFKRLGFMVILAHPRRGSPLGAMNSQFPPRAVLPSSTRQASAPPSTLCLGREPAAQPQHVSGETELLFHPRFMLRSIR
jgi:hypothetical protein